MRIADDAYTATSGRGWAGLSSVDCSDEVGYLTVTTD